MPESFLLFLSKAEIVFDDASKYLYYTGKADPKLLGLPDWIKKRDSWEGSNGSQAYKSEGLRLGLPEGSKDDKSGFGGISITLNEDEWSRRANRKFDKLLEAEDNGTLKALLQEELQLGSIYGRSSDVEAARTPAASTAANTVDELVETLGWALTAEDTLEALQTVSSEQVFKTKALALKSIEEALVNENVTKAAMNAAKSLNEVKLTEGQKEALAEVV